MTAILIIAGAVGVAIFIALTRLISSRLRWLREDFVYALILIVTALQYLTWARRHGTPPDVTQEIVGTMLFTSFAVLGLRWSLILAVGWVLHAAWDFALHPMPATSWVPWWFPPLCIGFDITLGAWIAARTIRA